MEQLFRPQLIGETPEDNFRQLTDYLYQLTEQLEFILDNIGEDNLSQGLAEKLNRLGAGIDANATLTSEAQSRIGALDIISVADVINSPMFTSALSTQESELRAEMDEKDTALKEEVLPKESAGAVSFPSGTMVCYGSVGGTTASFAKSFKSAPKVVTSKDIEYTVTASGITVAEAATFDYIAIGEV